MTRVVNPQALSCHPARGRRQLRSFLRDAGWPGDVEAVVLAVHEALMNSFQHAGGCTSALAGLDDLELVVEVRDAGPGFDLDRFTGQPPSTLAERGRGLWLISRIADRYQVERRNGTTCFRLAFHP